MDKEKSNSGAAIYSNVDQMGQSVIFKLPQLISHEPAAHQGTSWALQRQEVNVLFISLWSVFMVIFSTDFPTLIIPLPQEPIQGF